MLFPIGFFTAHSATEKESFTTLYFFALPVQHYVHNIRMYLFIHAYIMNVRKTVILTVFFIGIPCAYAL
jgi:hypothetical protein